MWRKDLLNISKIWTLKLAKVGNREHVELKDLYHDKVKILDKLTKRIWEEKKMEMKVQIVTNVVSILDFIVYMEGII
jgi:hypothetical protein